MQYGGPIISFPTQIESLPEIINTCGVHENHSMNNFCCICGKKVYEDTRQKDWEVQVNEIIGYDRMIQKNEDGVTYLFSNKIGVGFHFDSLKSPQILSPEVIDIEINKFKEIHNIDITSLEEHFKIELVVQFGLIEIYT